jgi:hypothetical protein
MTRLDRKLAVGVVALIALPLATAARAPLSASERGKTANKIFSDAQTAMRHLKNFHVLGHAGSGAQAVHFNLSLSPKGGGGSVSFFPKATMELVVAARTVYVKADEKSWMKLSDSKTTAKLVANKWIKVPLSNPAFSDLAQFAISTSFLNTMASYSGALNDLSGTVIWGRRKALVLKDNEGDKLLIADVGVPYMLHFQGSTGSSSGSLTFFDFGDAPMPTVPTRSMSLADA